ncbi:hypothetical protein JTE90_026548 [Oedothorax gibbosus]|uniref:Uncharacterized protein n=1 Tax=Oedothorax gibbosus TaxID=931172 RepID=A0AAV6U6K4_9ARAC|nr:hypothetical protein JTE90_026548 [Oedothorax gibbosus]
MLKNELLGPVRPMELATTTFLLYDSNSLCYKKCELHLHQTHTLQISDALNGTGGIAAEVSVLSGLRLNSWLSEHSTGTTWLVTCQGSDLT